MRVTEDTIKWSRANLNQMRYVVILLHIWSGSSSIIPFYLAFLGFNFSKWAAKNKGFHCSKSHFSSVQVLTYTTYSSLKGTFLIGELIISKWWNGATWCDLEGAVVWLAGAAELVSWSIQSFLAARKRRMLNQTKPTNILKYSVLGS